ncbi:uncharacterized protein B0H18DRAFT_4344 [Fomitopsis serialis]|uniref:uncharacterized protein n=1 Tax=Fomitopsis serialis TaxID=139415 RepID=UPI00200726CD|nr:uncharacterized protein B0H18DRAFT_4344 [Neoantrodia serialis]KAH9938126.1 hypothetical protein B0H18DRAFT_4344 [Neoantrodia serialis]
MELTFVTDLGQSFVVEIDPNMELENVMALLEAESDIPRQWHNWVSETARCCSSGGKSTLQGGRRDDAVTALGGPRGHDSTATNESGTRSCRTDGPPPVR